MQQGSKQSQSHQSSDFISLHLYRMSVDLTLRFSLSSGPSSPRNVQALPLSVSAIQVRWQPPEDPNGGIIKYTIEYQPVGQGSPHPWVDTDNGNKTAKDVTALNGSTLYQFRVRASSKVPGEWSKFVQAMTQGDGKMWVSFNIAGSDMMLVRSQEILLN